MSLSRYLSVRTAVAVMGGALLLALMAPPAGAFGTPRPPNSPMDGFHGGPLTFTTETATVTLPAITCVKKGTDFFVELNAESSSSGAYNSAGVLIGCIKVRHVPGVVSLYSPNAAPAGVPGSSGSVNPKPGDTITMTVTCGSGGSSVTLDDATSSEALTSTSSVPGPCDLMSVGSFVDNGGLPEMNSIAWSNVTVNGAPLSSIPLSVSHYFRSFRRATLTAGALTSGGTAFNETYATPAL